MRMKYFSILFFLLMFIVPASAQELMKLSIDKVSKVKPEWETFVKLIDSTVVHVWIENGWINAEHKNIKNELLWRTLIARGSINNKPKIERENFTIKITDASGKYFIKTQEQAFTSRFITGNLEDALKEGAHGFSPEEYNVDLIQPKSASDDYSLKKLEKDGWDYLAVGSKESENVIGLFRITHQALTEELFNETSEQSGHRNTVQEGKHHFFWDGNFLYAEQTPDEYLNKRVKRDLVISNSPAPELSVEKWYNTSTDIKLSDMKGRPVLLYFWSYRNWPSLKPMKKLQYLAEKYKTDGLEIVAIYSDDKKNYIERYMEENPDIKIQIGMDSGRTMKDYGLTGVGRFFIIDRNGKIIKAYLNMIPNESTIADLLK